MKNNLSETQEQRPRAKRWKKRKSKKPEMVRRTIEITSFATSMRLNVVQHKADEPYVQGEPWLELRGTATEGLKGVTNVKISMWTREKLEVGTARPASVGSVLGTKPELSFGLSWPQREFDCVWNLALSGHLKFAYLYFTKPHYNSGLVVSASFSNELEE